MKPKGIISLGGGGLQVDLCIHDSGERVLKCVTSLIGSLERALKCDRTHSVALSFEYYIHVGCPELVANMVKCGLISNECAVLAGLSAMPEGVGVPPHLPML